MYKPALTAGALIAMLSVILGAFGAHGLKNILPPAQLAIYATAVTYQFYHSFGLLIAGIMYKEFPHKQLRLTTLFFISGILFFSGSLYLMTFLSISGAQMGLVGALTPIGGLLFILGWLFLFLGIIKKSAL